MLIWTAAPIVASKTCIVVDVDDDDDDDEDGDGVSDLTELIVVPVVVAAEVAVVAPNQWDYCFSYRHLPYHRSNYFQDGLYSLQFVRYRHLDGLLLHLVSIVSVGMMIDSYSCLILSFLSLHLPLALKSERLRVLTLLFLDYPCPRQWIY